MAFFNKKNKSEADRYIDEVLDWQEEEIIVVRGKDCKTLYLNAASEKKLGGLSESTASCQAGYSSHFIDLCEKCPCKGGKEAEQTERFDVEDIEGSVFSVRAKAITWIDEKPAVMLALRNVTELRQSEEHLFSLAYIDQLTNIPNRRKFIEDYNSIEKEVSAGRLAGFVALFDLDNFKSINDTYGHNTGDIMLRRLTEYISEITEFKGKLYRLGGDEFVIMISGKADEFATFEDLAEYYTEVLSATLRTYTIPNIELSCTLSMGVAFFPRHGETTYELLRKSDIALYKAKEKGRNCLTVFEDKYDQAKKFKDLYINIQPLLMADGMTYGYELVDRGAGEDDESGLVNLTELNRTLDALALEDIDNGIVYFINYTDQLLSPIVLNNLPVDKFIIQLHVPGQITRVDVNRILGLRKNNYSIALTGINSKNVTQEMLNYVKFCKFDKADKNQMMQKRIIAANPDVDFIASDINSHEDFNKARSAGYKLFQGFFFKEPIVTKKTKELNPIPANYFRLLQLTSTQEHVDFKEISKIISCDVALSYKLLQILNSAAVGLKNVSSISMAVAYLGEENLKKWVGLLALRGIADDKPIELVRMSLIRAQFGELLAPHIKNRKATKHLFLLGMLSLLHIALEITKEELLEEIPVAEEIRDSLLTKTGPYSSILQFYEHYEYANWDDVTRFADEQGISCQTINECYMGAVKWYGDLISSS